MPTAVFCCEFMVSKDLTKEVFERAASLKIKIEKYYEQLEKQVNERTIR
jgi:hypothetical protein